MKLYRKRDFNKSGIYAIKNLSTNKIYIGKAKCIYRRIQQHINQLNKKSKDENRYLINAWHKYGRNDFEYFVIEYLPLDDTLISERELYWQEYYDALNRDKGYNLRKDSKTGLIVSDETRRKLSDAQNKRFKDPEERKKCSHDFWQKNPESLKQMSIKLKSINSIYYIDQYDKEGKFLKRWENISELISINVNYKPHNIYAVCSGEKPSMYGFKWKKELKVNKDIVQS